jgi:signal transduction histidine kinase
MTTQAIVDPQEEIFSIEKMMEDDLTAFFQKNFTSHQILVSIRFWDRARNLLIRRFLWQKQFSENMPETDEEIAVQGTVGGDAVITKMRQYVPEIDKDQRFHKHGHIYVQAGYLSMVAYPLYGIHNEVIGVVQVYFDQRNYTISETEEVAIQEFSNTIERFILIREATSRAIENERMKIIHLIASGLSHELRQPLTCIGGFSTRISTEIKRLRAELPEAACNTQIKELLSSIQQEADIIATDIQRIESVLIDFLKFSPDSLRTESISVANLVNKATDYFNRKNGKISIKKEILSEALVIVDDRSMRLAIMELLQNAAKVAEINNSRQIQCHTHLVTRDGQNMVCIEVVNKGDISPENLPKIFEPFFTTDKKTGTGLGLSQIQLTVSRHNGTIEIVPENGQVYARIYLPVA